MPRQDTSTRITRAARELFLAHGVEGISMRGIAARVGLSATAIYRHFRDKDAVIDALTEEGHALFREYLSRGPRKSAPLDRLRLLGLHYLDFALDHPHDYELIFLVPRKHVRRFPRDFAMTSDLNFHHVSRGVSEAIEAGVFDENDPMEVALALWAHVHGIVVLQRAGVLGTSRTRLRAHFRRSVEWLFAGLKPTGSTERS